MQAGVVMADSNVFRVTRFPARERADHGLSSDSGKRKGRQEVGLNLPVGSKLSLPMGAALVPRESRGDKPETPICRQLENDCTSPRILNSIIVTALLLSLGGFVIRVTN